MDQEGVAHLEPVQPDRVGPAEWVLGGESSSPCSRVSACMQLSSACSAVAGASAAPHVTSVTRSNTCKNGHIKLRVKQMSVRRNHSPGLVCRLCRADYSFQGTSSGELRMIRSVCAVNSAACVG